MAATVRAVFPTGTTATTVGAVTTITTSVTASAGDALSAHVVVSSGSDGALNLSSTANSIASDGTSGEIHSNTQTAGFEQFFHWIAPSSGTYNVVTTVTGGTPDAMGQKVYAVQGSNNATPSYTTFAFNDTTNRTAATITSPTMPTGSVGISGFCAGSSFSSTGQTTQLNASVGGASGATEMCGASTAGAGSTVNFTATISSADWYAAMVAVWAQAGGTDATVTFPQSVSIHP